MQAMINSGDKSRGGAGSGMAMKQLTDILNHKCKIGLCGWDVCALQPFGRLVMRFQPSKNCVEEYHGGHHRYERQITLQLIASHQDQ